MGDHSGQDLLGASYEELADSYVRRFKEVFPTYLAPCDAQVQMQLMREALVSGKAYDPYRDPTFDPEADY